MNQIRSAQNAATLLRLALGTMYLSHGLLKLMVFTPAGTSGFFASIGLPAFLGTVVMVAEIAGGLALLLGFYSRAVVAALLPVLIGSIFFVHGSSGWVFSNDGGGWEYPLFLAVASVVQYFLGDGIYSIRSTLSENYSLQKA